MGSTMRTLDWSIVVSDTDHWTPKQIEEADRCNCHSYDDHVAHRIAAFMTKAGEAFVRANPELFRVGLT